MKAVVLLSGGLDSSLALKMIADQGVEVIALHFASPFCRCDGAKGCGASARVAASYAGVEITNVFLAEEYLEVIKNPKYGRGKNMNVCIDCRILKFSHAKKIMQKNGASFIVTGEVVGQRPMSQHKQTMALIEHESGLDDLIVRPLSAHIMKETLPEREGWVDRTKFQGISGRTRKPQIQLAEDLGIIDYPCPAGGCLLTDPEFSKRIKDLMDHKEFNLDNVELIKTGRYFRLSETAQLAVGRNEAENIRLDAMAKEADLIFWPKEIPGPIGLGRGVFSEKEIETAATIIARYSDITPGGATEVVIRKTSSSDEQTKTVSSAEETLLRSLRI